MMKQFKAKSPIVLCGTVHKDECILESTDRHAVTEGNIDVYDIKVFGCGTIDWFTARCFGMVMYAPIDAGNLHCLYMHHLL